MIVKIQCPHCGAQLHVSEKALGRESPCPTCNRPIKIPADMGAMMGLSGSQSGGVSSGLAAPPSGPPAGMPPLPESAQPSPETGSPRGLGPGSPSPAPTIPPIPFSEQAPSGGTQPISPPRPFGLVWIIFYWICTGLGIMMMSSIRIYIAINVGFFADQIPFRLRSRPDIVTERIVIELTGALFLLMFHLGLLTLVVCYGLWFHRQWGLFWARVLSLVYAILAGLSLFTLLAGWPFAIVLTNLLISICIVIYFYGMTELSDRVRRYYEQVRSQMSSPNWTEFR